MNEMMIKVLEKKEELEKLALQPRIRFFVNPNFSAYLKVTLDMLLEDISNVIELEDNTEYIKTNERFSELKQRVSNISNDAKNALLLKPINPDFYTFIDSLSLFLTNWNNIYNDQSITENINSMLKLISLSRTLPEILERLQINMEHMQNMLNAKERNNPLVYRTSASYLAAIKKSFEKK